MTDEDYLDFFQGGDYNKYFAEVYKMNIDSFVIQNDIENNTILIKISSREINSSCESVNRKDIIKSTSGETYMVEDKVKFFAPQLNGKRLLKMKFTFGKMGKIDFNQKDKYAHDDRNPFALLIGKY